MSLVNRGEEGVGRRGGEVERGGTGRKGRHGCRETETSERKMEIRRGRWKWSANR